MLQAYNERHSPTLFPVRELLQMLIRIISVAPSKIQQLANIALVQVRGCSGSDRLGWGDVCYFCTFWIKDRTLCLVANIIWL